MVHHYRRHEQDSFNENPLKQFHGFVTEYDFVAGTQIVTSEKIHHTKNIGDCREIYCDTLHNKAKRKGWRGQGNMKKFLNNLLKIEDMDEEINDL